MIRCKLGFQRNAVSFGREIKEGEAPLYPPNSQSLYKWALE